jgi:hypothetical protein
MKLMPASNARWMMANDSSSLVGLGKFIAPRHNGDTSTPVRPKDLYSIPISFLSAFFVSVFNSTPFRS